MDRCRQHAEKHTLSVCVACIRDGQALIDRHWEHETARWEGERQELLERIRQLELVEARQRPQLGGGPVPEIGSCVYFIRREAFAPEDLAA